MTIKTPDEFRDEIRGILAKEGDQESRHILLDRAVWSLLRDWGYDEAIDLIVDTPKWYA